MGDAADAKEEFGIDRFAGIGVLADRELGPLRGEARSGRGDEVGMLARRDRDVDGVLDVNSLSQRRRGTVAAGPLSPRSA